MAGSHPTELQAPKGAVGQNGVGSAGAHPVELGRDKGAVQHVAAVGGGGAVFELSPVGIAASSDPKIHSLSPA
jgi:hypothetical protein